MRSREHLPASVLKGEHRRRRFAVLPALIAGSLLFGCARPPEVVAPPVAPPPVEHEAPADRERGKAELAGGIEGRVWALVWTRDDRLVVLHARYLSVVDLAARRRVARVSLGSGAEEKPAAGISADGRWVLVMEGGPRLFGVRELAPGPRLAPTPELGGASFLGSAFSADGSRVALGYIARDEQSSRRITVWETAGGAPVAHLPSDRAEPQLLAFSPSGALLAAGDVSGRAEVWELPSPLPVLVASAWSPSELRRFHPDATQKMERSIDAFAFLRDETALGAVWGGELHVLPIAKRAPASPKVVDGPVFHGGPRRPGLWDPQTGKWIEPIWSGDDKGVARAPDGVRFALVNGLGAVRIESPGHEPEPVLPPTPKAR